MMKISKEATLLSSQATIVESYQTITSVPHASPAAKRLLWKYPGGIVEVPWDGRLFQCHPSIVNEQSSENCAPLRRPRCV